MLWGDSCVVELDVLWGDSLCMAALSILPLFFCLPFSHFSLHPLKLGLNP